MRAKRGKRKTLVDKQNEQLGVELDKGDCLERSFVDGDVVYSGGVVGIDWSKYRLFRVTKTGMSIVAKDLGKK